MFKRCLGKRAICFLNDLDLQYVAVENVSTFDIEHIDYLRDHRDLLQMRILYNEEKKLMIVKLRPVSLTK